MSAYAMIADELLTLAIRRDGPTKTSDGLRVTDVWKTKEVFGKFSEQKIGPITKEFGLPQPSVQFFEVHNYLTKG